MSLFRKPDLRKSELSQATMTDYGAEVDIKIGNCVSGLAMATLPIAICSSSALGRFLPVTILASEGLLLADREDKWH
jgi:hypothetical protein